MNAPERQYTLLLKLGADSREELVAALTQIAIECDRQGSGGVTVRGTLGSSFVMQVAVNSDQTHEKYFEQLEAHLDELRREEEARKS